MDERLAAELRTIFVAELEEHLAALNRDLLGLERATPAEQPGHLERLFRTTHTLKGAARAASLPLVEQASHRLEDVLAGLQAGRLTPSPALFELLFAATDALGDAGERTAAGRSLEDAPLLGVISRLGLVAGTDLPAVPVPEAVEDTAPSAVVPGLRIAADKVDEVLARSGELLVALRRLDARADDLRSRGVDVTGFNADRRAIVTVAAALDEVVRRLRMVPFREATVHLDRAARDVAQATGKDVTLTIRGGEIEVDRVVLEALRDPLLHLVRNAVDHGMEPPAEREAAGKPGRGTITVTASLRGAEVLVEVADDGRGIDPGAIRTKLRERGAPVPADERDVLRTIFAPGFSTASVVTDLSGRGVGLDAVKTSVEALRGAVDVRSGDGTTFSLRVPLSLSTLRVLEVAVGGQVFVIPVPAIRVLLRVDRGDVRPVRGIDTIEHEGRPIPLVPLSAVLGLEAQPQLTTGKLAVVVLSYGSDVGLVVDALLDERDAVVKSLGPRLRGAPIASGATLLANGRVALILDVPEIVARARRGGTAIRDGMGEAEAPKPKILLVDDSMTTRSLEKTILENAGYTVVIAVDGADGWRVLQETPGIGVVVSDVEMPRMDGFGLTEAIRASPRFQHLPVILVTALAKPEDKARGLAAGASAYIVKGAFEQQQLLDTIEQLA